MYITFSGIDGSGKSTLIERLRIWLAGENRPAVVLTLYDHLSVYALLRKMRDFIKQCFGAGYCKETFPGAASQGNGRPSGGEVRDPHPGVKDKEGWVLKIVYGAFRNPFVRRAALFLDVLVLMGCRLYFEKLKGKILIIDRYFYDTLIDIAYEQGPSWHGLRILFDLMPRPSLCVFVRVDPEEAFRRKPEYPLDYIRWRSEAYRRVEGWAKEALTIVNEDLNQADQTLKAAVRERLS